MFIDIKNQFIFYNGDSNQLGYSGSINVSQNVRNEVKKNEQQKTMNKIPTFTNYYYLIYLLKGRGGGGVTVAHLKTATGSNLLREACALSRPQHSSTKRPRVDSSFVIFPTFRFCYSFFLLCIFLLTHFHHNLCI